MRTVVVESLAERVEQTKGGTIQPRTAELLELRGLLEAMHARAVDREPVGGHFATLPVPLDCSRWQTRHPYPLSIRQDLVEEVLEHAALARGAGLRRGHPVTDAEQDTEGVTVTTTERTFRARYLVACDGGHSTVRKLLRLPFPGRPGTFQAVLAEIRLASVSALVPERAGHISGLTRAAGGYWSMLVPVGGDRYRLTFAPEDEAAALSGPVTESEIVDALTVVYGEDTRLAHVLAASRWSDATRQLDHYRHGRILFAGDAAHIHPPLGGQGLNLGVQNAINLGWKLAATLHGWAPDGLLDTYQEERHPAAARVLHHTSAQRVLAGPNPAEDVAALRDIFTDLLSLPDTNHRLAGMMSGLDAPGRVPDAELVTDEGTTRLSALLRSGRGLLLDLTGGHPLPPGWSDRVDRVHAKPDHQLTEAALLLRPDGYRCWSPVGGPLEAALSRWFGVAATGDAV
ncbi:2-polyprenyl-6-methoxyphenol hydroxylase-like FAD-dependent oxidoreductase [Amycolatopsis thermophila]|uniref:2-polyprenyl-6-methoxyphenol hydroxylase-like FAD-dependent oxidoreductase n=1 Tax=Amycolatopsis thermophila TaxID=206084 RepID=A0ABU0EU98_9PSEU|nr:FAD-dependent monooxygenase [Amycolatopsis thermophila]MDQ0378888.1 2-polyprenyl-6-methoxyphenol hydroxylase-like FAD-dependent oxidoreductase [Amycolatopsis thermophila]